MRNVLYILFLSVLVSCSGKSPVNVAYVDTLPGMFPDYDSVTIPAGIAPLNFDVEGARYLIVRAEGSLSGVVEVDGDYCDFPIDEWRSLTEKNVGGQISVSLTAQLDDGKWVRYNPFHIFVSSDSLGEYGLTYRRIRPGYETYSDIGIFQRDIHSFDEFAIVDHTALQGECMNCHVANRCDASQFQLHIRGEHSATLLQMDGQRRLLRTKTDSTIANCMYAYWHPSGRYCAYGISNVGQTFWEDTARYIMVSDFESQIAVMDVETNELVLSSSLNNGDLNQYPSFSPDGDTMYFCNAAPYTDSTKLTDIRYNLCAVSFDAESGKAGTDVDTLFDARKMLRSVAHPKPSYDGRFIIFAVTDCSVFPIHIPSSDLYIMDLRSWSVRPLHELNSCRAESYANWNTTSRWIVFSSRRYNNVQSFLYLAHVDSTGHAGKPFMLPQRNPRDYYHKMMHSYNVPDFTLQKVELDVRAFASEIYSDSRIQVGIRR